MDRCGSFPTRSVCKPGAPSRHERVERWLRRTSETPSCLHALLEPVDQLWSSGEFSKRALASLRRFAGLRSADTLRVAFFLRYSRCHVDLRELSLKRGPALAVSGFDFRNQFVGLGKIVGQQGVSQVFQVLAQVFGSLRLLRVAAAGADEDADLQLARKQVPVLDLADRFFLVAGFHGDEGLDARVGDFIEDGVGGWVIDERATMLN